MKEKIQNKHLEKMAYIYLRQSTMGQVLHNQESTQRQYALRDKALELGWPPESIRVLDGDLGLSGTQMNNRTDFKTLVADVSMKKVGAVFSIEASRLSRSEGDWHRLLELCALSGTLIIDEDGCYNPSEFNDTLLLGLKGTMSQAELHFIRARLQGGKLNKAKKGELKFPLPVGLCYGDDNTIVIDPDREVRHAVTLLFKAFRETGSAYGVMRYFADRNLQFPKRAYGGVWNGKLIWGQLSHGRVIGVLKNPSYAGTYVYGRYKYEKRLSEKGEVSSHMRSVPMPSWQVAIKDHHEGYIAWDDFLKNQKTLQNNQTNTEDTLLSKNAREGYALLQGMMICGVCGRRITIRYKGNGGVYPIYECNGNKNRGLTKTSCLSFNGKEPDKHISEKILEKIKPEQVKIAIKAMEDFEQRNESIESQWKIKIERVEYEAQLAQRRYEEVDPSNRLVASTLEKRWNDALVKAGDIKKQYVDYKNNESLVINANQKKALLALAKDLPRLWKANSTTSKDKKKILRYFINDITVEKIEKKKLVFHIRWQGGSNEDIYIPLPLNMCDRVRYPETVIEKVRALVASHSDQKIADHFNASKLKSSKGKRFTASMINWIRFAYKIERPVLNHPDEFSVAQIANKFQVSHHVVYYWIKNKLVTARKIGPGNPWWIMLDSEKEVELAEWVKNSLRISKTKKQIVQNITVGGAV